MERAAGGGGTRGGRRGGAGGGSGSKSKAKAKPKPSTSFSPAPPSPASPAGFAFGLRASAARPSPSSLPKPKSPHLVSPASDAAAVSSVADLKSLASSYLDSLRRRLDLLHSDALKDLDASHSRISKRFKIQTQACLQLTDEVDKDYKKMTDRIKESAEIMKTSYKETMAEAQSSTTRVCKVTLPEMAKSVEKTIDSLRSRYNIPVIPV